MRVTSNETPRPTFEHERLLVYGRAADFLTVAHQVIARLPRTRAAASVADQLQRAATSISLNIAEGSGEFSPLEKIRFYRYSVRSAAECAAVLDVVVRLHPTDAEVVAEGKEHLHAITGMLLALIRSQEIRGAATPAGARSR